MRRFIVCFLFLCLYPLPSSAQWYKQAGRTIKKAFTSTLPHTSVAPTLARPLERQVAQATQAAAKPATNPWQKTVFTIQEKDLFLRFTALEGTAFVIEETYKGEKYLWGVTASHYLFQKPALKHPLFSHAVRVPFVIQGSSGRNDISLFLIPDEFAASVTPLKLAPQDPPLGETVSSIGYWNQRLHVDRERVVKEVSPAEIITSLKIDPEALREGTCGSPVLNQKREVVGMHAGNSPRRQEGYVIPVSHIRQALQAYHQGNFEQKLLFKGQELGTVAINEFLSSVVVAYPQGIQKTNLSLRQRQVDYNHLEKWAPQNPQAKSITFFIKRNPLSTQQKDKNYYIRWISYNLQTGEISHSKEPTSRLFPWD